MAIYQEQIKKTKPDRRFVNPIALAKLKWKYYAVYIVIDFFVAFVAWLSFPETRRMSIEEISLVFDYGTKEGRARALEQLHNAPADNTDGKLDGDEELGGKEELAHIEDSQMGNRK